MKCEQSKLLLHESTSMTINFLTDGETAESVIRAWHQELETQQGHKAMTIRFDYVIAKASEKTPELRSQWEIVTTLLPKDESSAFCICGHLITRKYYIRNKYNGNILRIGHECIMKLGVDTDLKEDVEAYRLYEQRDKRKRRQCLSCGKYRIGVTQPSFKTQCRGCFRDKSSLNKLLVHLQQEGKIVKACETCQQEFLIEPEEPWKTKCMACYRISLLGLITQYCNLCGKRFTVNPNEAKWKLKCTQCYFRGKAAI